MNCDPERLSFYLDGELSPEEVHKLREHLAGCQRCSEDLARYGRIESSVRRLGYKPPPHELRRGLYQRLEERRRGRLRARLRSLARTPAGPLTAVAVLAVGSAVTWRSLPPPTAPVMTAAFAVQETPDTLDGLRVELVFDRPVAADSLAEGLAIEPPLPVAQRVVDNKVELIPQVPLAIGSSYTMTISNVRDQRGNTQMAPVVLNLAAGPAATIVQQSGPAEPVPARVDTAGAVEGSGVWPFQAASATARPAAARPSQIPTAQALAGVPGSGPALAPVGQAPLPAGAANGLVNTMLVQPPPTVTVAERGGSAVLEVNPELERRLGATGGPERLTLLGEQAYQGGAMLWRSDSNQVYALVRSTGRWLSFPNTWRRGEVLEWSGTRPPGTLEPLRGFGKIWRDQPAVKLQLGWPVYEERDATGGVQAFANGNLIRSAYGVVYALFNDGSWRTLPDVRR